MAGFQLPVHVPKVLQNTPGEEPTPHLGAEITRPRVALSEEGYAMDRCPGTLWLANLCGHNQDPSFWRMPKNVSDRGSDLDPKWPLDFLSDQFYRNAWRCGDPSDSEPRSATSSRFRVCSRPQPASAVGPLAQPPRESSFFRFWNYAYQTGSCRTAPPLTNLRGGWHWQ